MNGPGIVSFVGGAHGTWQVQSIHSVAGEPIASVPFLTVKASEGLATNAGQDWHLRGRASNIRYAQRRELDRLGAVQPDLGRAEASCAALIPIRKSGAWWTLAEDERREIIEERSRHFAIGTDYLPAIARQLLHCRDLGEPFDFLTWFEFAPAEAGRFDDLLGKLRASEEWTYVEREVEIRVCR